MHLYYFALLFSHNGARCEGDAGVCLSRTAAQLLSSGSNRKAPRAGASPGGELSTSEFKVPLVNSIMSSFLELSPGETHFGHQPFLEKHFRSSVVAVFLQRDELGEARLEESPVFQQLLLTVPDFLSFLVIICR